jgi:hypothetical protein
VQGGQGATSHWSVVIDPTILFQHPSLRGLADALQNAAQTRSYLVVTADALNILPIVADVEVIDGKVNQLGLIARSSVELGEASLVLRRPRVVFGHETAEVFLALGYGLLPEKSIGRSADPLLQLNDLVVLHG